MDNVDKTTRMFDRKVLDLMDGYLKHQIEEFNAGKPRNPEKFKQGAEELLQRAETLQDLETAVKRGHKRIELPKYLAPEPKPEPVQKSKQTHNKIVAMPTPGQLQTIVSRELDRKVEKLKGDLISVIRNELKVAK